MFSKPLIGQALFVFIIGIGLFLFVRTADSNGAINATRFAPAKVAKVIRMHPNIREYKVSYYAHR